MFNEENESAVVAEPTTPEAPLPAPEQPRRRQIPFVINWPVMLVVIGLILLTVFALLLNQNAIPSQFAGWWPLVVTVPAVLWFLGALVRGDPRGVLGSAAVFGVGLSLLLSVQRIAPLGATLVGITFIATGTAVVLRGLLIPNRPIRS